MGSWSEFYETLVMCEPSDVLVMIDPRCWPTSGFQIATLLDHFSVDSRRAIHLVALEKGVAGTREHVDFDSERRVRPLRRYYDGVTLPFIAGVAASVLSVSCTQSGEGFAPILSLDELRLRLAARGVLSSDVPIQGEGLDLDDERGLIAASQRAILEATSLP